jgi:succinate-acetate transporter protein
MPLGLFGLAAASLVVSGLELGWISTSQRIFVGVVIVAFPVSLQLVASVLSFLSRDAATASGLGVLATTWLAIGAVFIISPPGSTSGALGLLLLVSAVALTLSGVAGTLNKLVPAAVLIVSGARFAATGVYELSALEPWQDAAGAIGLGLTALALYTAFALELEDAKGQHGPAAAATRSGTACARRIARRAARGRRERGGRTQDPLNASRRVD